MEKMNQAFEKMKMLVGVEVDDEASTATINDDNSSWFMDDFNRNCTLSTKQRLYGFAICFVSGLTCTLMSMLVFFNPIKFGIAFTLGNMLSLGRFHSSCCFVIGWVGGVANRFLPLVHVIDEYGTLRNVGGTFMLELYMLIR
ncbi:vesicle transport protein SFT2B-like, partial [Cucurbita pepo subsp. pepo]|uniref:vesicle transport protein SFT2B-like n=1 Tax=Cucurbita pepo subsp. pepo TaxID=3664 RepID=UPI000C9D5461